MKTSISSLERELHLRGRRVPCFKSTLAALDANPSPHFWTGPGTSQAASLSLHIHIWNVDQHPAFRHDCLGSKLEHLLEVFIPFTHQEQNWAQGPTQTDRQTDSHVIRRHKPKGDSQVTAVVHGNRYPDIKVYREGPAGQPAGGWPVSQVPRSAPQSHRTSGKTLGTLGLGFPNSKLLCNQPMIHA